MTFKSNAQHEHEEKVLLIVDDEPSLREVLSFYFGLQGFDVLEAANGREALEVVRSRPVDVVLSDIRMPVMDGLRLLSELKEAATRIPILLMTGFAEIDEAEAKRQGAGGLITKPFDLERLNHLVEEASHSKQAS